MQNEIVERERDWQRAIIIETYEQAKEFSIRLAKTDFVPKIFKGKPDDILCAIVFGSELKLKPLQALQNIAVINGKPCIYGDAALAIVRIHPAFLDIKETISGTGDSLTATCIVSRRSQSDVIRTFSFLDAKKAGLLGKPGPWSQYSSRMLQMRARSWALRDMFPDALSGLYIREEAEDITEYPITTEFSNITRESTENEINILENKSQIIEKETIKNLEDKKSMILSSDVQDKQQELSNKDLENRIHLDLEDKLKQLIEKNEYLRESVEKQAETKGTSVDNLLASASIEKLQKTFNKFNDN